MKRSIPTIASAFIAGSISASANDAINFWNTNYARRSAPIENKPQSRSHSNDRARIYAATTAAAQRHGVPVEFMHRLVMRESGYRFVQGPPTKWGRAQGPFQILCSTAASLGEPDCNRLMHDAERSADLSARYVRMGYDATGSWHGAAAHYHGGSNRRLWGRKTAAYASAVGGKPFPRTASLSAPPVGTFGPAIVPASFSAMQAYAVIQ